MASTYMLVLFSFIAVCTGLCSVSPRFQKMLYHTLCDKCKDEG